MHAFQAKERYAYQDHIAGPWYVERANDNAVVVEGLSQYQATIAALALTLADEIVKPDFEGGTVAEIYLELGYHIS